MRCTPIIAVLMILAASAKAIDMTGMQLFEYCGKETGAENLMCVAYIAGYTDGAGMGEALSLKTKTAPSMCLPKDVNVAATRAHVMKILREDPQLMRKQARDILGLTMWELFPCQK